MIDKYYINYPTYNCLQDKSITYSLYNYKNYNNLEGTINPGYSFPVGSEFQIYSDSDRYSVPVLQKLVKCSGSVITQYLTNINSWLFDYVRTTPDNGTLVFTDYNDPAKLNVVMFNADGNGAFSFNQPRVTETANTVNVGPYSYSVMKLNGDSGDRHILGTMNYYNPANPVYGHNIMKLAVDKDGSSYQVLLDSVQTGSNFGMLVGDNNNKGLRLIIYDQYTALEDFNHSRVLLTVGDTFVKVNADNYADTTGYFASSAYNYEDFYCGYDKATGNYDYHIEQTATTDGLDIYRQSGFMYGLGTVKLEAVNDQDDADYGKMRITTVTGNQVNSVFCYSDNVLRNSETVANDTYNQDINYQAPGDSEYDYDIADVVMDNSDVNSNTYFNIAFNAGTELDYVFHPLIAYQTNKGYKNWILTANASIALYYGNNSKLTSTCSFRPTSSYLYYAIISSNNGNSTADWCQWSTGALVGDYYDSLSPNIVSVKKTSGYEEILCFTNLMPDGTYCENYYQEDVSKQSGYASGGADYILKPILGTCDQPNSPGSNWVCTGSAAGQYDSFEAAYDDSVKIRQKGDNATIYVSVQQEDGSFVKEVLSTDAFNYDSDAFKKYYDTDTHRYSLSGAPTPKYATAELFGKYHNYYAHSTDGTKSLPVLDFDFSSSNNSNSNDTKWLCNYNGLKLFLQPITT